MFGEGGLLSAMTPGSVLVDCTSNDPACAARVAERLSRRRTWACSTRRYRARQRVRSRARSPSWPEVRKKFLRAANPCSTCWGRRWCTWASLRVRGCNGQAREPDSRGRDVSGRGGRPSCSGPRPVSTPQPSWTSWERVSRAAGGWRSRRPKFSRAIFSPGGKITSHVKDLRYALEQARERGVSLPGASLVAQIFNSLVANGEGELDHIAIIKVLERMAGVEARAL